MTLLSQLLLATHDGHTRLLPLICLQAPTRFSARPTTAKGTALTEMYFFSVTQTRPCSGNGKGRELHLGSKGHVLFLQFPELFLQHVQLQQTLR